MSNKNLKRYDLENSINNLSMSTDSSTELSKKMFKIGSPFIFTSNNSIDELYLKKQVEISSLQKFLI